MCQNCVRERFPDRGTTCLDAGCYVINFVSCAQCGKREPLRASRTLTANGIANDDDEGDHNGGESNNGEGDRHLSRRNGNDNLDDDDSDDEEERVLFEHACSSCGHVVARHEYAFQVDETFQNFSMMCLLCGRAEDSRSIMPEDPRLQPLY